MPCRASCHTLAAIARSGSLLRLLEGMAVAAYVLEGPRWGIGAMGTSGGTVTWAIDSSVPAAFASDIQAAFADWSAHTNISFQQVASTLGAGIKFSDSYIDGLDKTLGYTNYTYSGQSFTSANVTFDSGEGWHASGNQVVSTDGTNLFLVALHEIGHAIGLDHYNGAPAVMNATMNPSVTDLTASDVSGVQALYGAPSTTVATGAPTTPQGTDSTTSGLNAVYRFFDASTGDHFYTTSATEKQQILQALPSYHYEGVAWATPDKGPSTEDVYRFYDTATGDHFFTVSAAERDQILKTLPSYHYEGVAFEAYISPSVAGSGADTLERFYNTVTHVHHYAASPQETYGINHGSAGPGWIDEGPAFTVHTPTDGMLYV